MFYYSKNMKGVILVNICTAAEMVNDAQGKVTEVMMNVNGKTSLSSAVIANFTKLHTLTSIISTFCVANHY